MMGNYQVRFWRAVALVKESLTLIFNAAINILKRGLSTVGHTGTWVNSPNDWGEGTATKTGEILSWQVRSANQESPCMTTGECQG